MTVGQSGVSLIAAERERQVAQEGWTPEHDDQHRNGELAAAAACYAQEAHMDATHSHLNMPPNGWPWEDRWWKPSATPGGSRRQAAIRDLVKAGALIAAEIDRIQRMV